MSTRNEREKRIRPRNDPYKRDHFDKSRYLRIPSEVLKEEEGIVEAYENDALDDVEDDES